MSETLDRTHPIPDALSAARAAIAHAETVDPLFMTAAEHGTALRELIALEAQVADLKARILVAADGPAGTPSQVATEAGFADLRTWLTMETQMGPRAARAELRFAHALDQHPHLGAAMRHGDVSHDQADVIIRAVDALPEDLGPDLLTRAEQQLIDDAATFDPDRLRILGRRILEVVAPEIAEAAEEEALRREEQRAKERTRLTLKRLGDGTTRISGLLPDLAAARLAVFLNALLNPRRTPPWADVPQDGEADSEADREADRDSQIWWSLPGARKLGEAFCELLERINPDDLPTHGRTSTGILLTMELDKLQTGVGAATLHGPGGEIRVSARETRRLACRAGLIPAVLGTQSEVLDLGRTARLYSAAQTKALILRHPTCQARGCDIPAAWTEAHHLTPWYAGGKTDLKDGVLLCVRHHHLAHDALWTHTRAPDGQIDFTRA